jgi:hypothetical protein
MTTRTFIVLANSNASIVKNFRVVHGSLRPVRAKRQSERETITGKIDMAEGAIRQTWAMTLRVHYQETDASYGTLSTLQTFYGYVNPNGTPSNVLTFTDNLAQSYSVRLLGELVEENLTPYLDGTQAVYLIPISFVKVA